MSATLQNLISEKDRQQFRDEGFFVLPGVVPPEHLALMREVCGQFIAAYDAEMEAAGQTHQGINIKGSRYFIANRHKGTRLPEFIYSDLMAEICRATLGDNAYLFWEQFVVKGPEKGSKFSWHQDSAYVGTPHRPYITCWVTLDDVSEANGTVYLLPYSRAGTREVLPHKAERGEPRTRGLLRQRPGRPGSSCRRAVSRCSRARCCTGAVSTAPPTGVGCTCRNIPPSPCAGPTASWPRSPSRSSSTASGRTARVRGRAPGAGRSIATHAKARTRGFAR